MYMEGLNLGMPAQEVFRGWPPRSLIERSYWAPWNWLSFHRAALFGRPVVLVLTVGWSPTARKMLEETFRDPEVLEALNRDFITVLVDADRRPDIKERYQTGTWPVVTFLLPNAKPMLSQVDNPETSRPITAGYVDAEGMRFLLSESEYYWNKWSERLMVAGEAWSRREGRDQAQAGELDETASDVVAAWFEANADRENGGYGIAPKFVVPGMMEYAAMRSTRGWPDLLEHSRLTLERLIHSSLYDGSGGGSHRMATAPMWGGIQREKMLSGNTALLRDLVFALRQETAADLRAALRSTADFVAETLSAPDGGLYLAWVGPDAGADDKPRIQRLVLAGPNGLAGAALVRAGMLLEDGELVRRGREVLDLVHARAYRPGRGAGHVIESRPNDRVFLSAQADVAFGFVDAFESTGDHRYLEAARDIVDVALLNLGDSRTSLLRDHLPEARPVGLLSNPRHPLKPNVRLARTMLRLELLGLGSEYGERASEMLRSCAGDLSAYGVHGAEAALAIEEWLTTPLTIEIHGAPDDGPALELRRAAVNSPWPWTVIQTAAGEPGAAASAELVWKESRRTVGNAEQLDSAIREMTGLGQP